MNVRLSQHFTLDEFCKTSHPYYQDDVVSFDYVCNMQKLCILVLEPLRRFLGSPVRISSGYRSPRLNDEVGGAINSAHLTGRAADIPCSSLTLQVKIYDFLKSHVPPVKCVLKEHKNGVMWIHVNI